MENYGMAKRHSKKSKEIYNFIEKLDFENGDYFCFKSGGDGDNGEFLMDLLDVYFSKSKKKIKKFNKEEFWQYYGFIPVYAIGILIGFGAIVYNLIERFF